MAPKKPTIKKPVAVPNTTKKTEEAQKRVDGDGYPRVKIRGKYRTFELLSDELGARQRERDDIALQLPALIQQHTRLLEAGDVQELDAWRKGDGKEATREHRKTQAERLRDAQSLLEDFLYFQNHTHRRNRLYDLDAKTSRRREDGKITQADYKLMPSDYVQDRYEILNAFDNHYIGTPSHRHGLRDWDGQEITDGTPTSSLKLVQPNALRLWTPACRHIPVGLGTVKNMPIEDTNFKLDADAITKRWKEIEDSNLPEEDREDFPYRTHAERRQQERDMYMTQQKSTDGDLEMPDESIEGNDACIVTRPTTACVHARTTSDGTETMDWFRDIQKSEGVFHGALESSYDWRTSYDLLGPVRNGVHANFPVSEEREMIERPPDDEMDNNKASEEANSTSDQVSKTTNEASQSESSKKRKAKGSKTKGSKKKAKEAMSQTETPTKENRVQIDYPYITKEFHDSEEVKKGKPLTKPVDLRDALVSTSWCEETYGRREWHVNMLLSPASPVDSPPHSPIQPPADNEDRNMPDTFPDEEANGIKETAKRRCTHNPEKCRAWWTHAADECWIVQSEQAPRQQSPDPTAHPFIDMPQPKTFMLPESGRPIYAKRTTDHYGMMGKGNVAWPRVGVRVPYEPMTLDDLKSPTSHGNMEDDSNVEQIEKKVVFEVHSMAAPLIAMSPRIGHNEGIDPVAEDKGGDNNENDNPDESDESDYEGDLFYQTYMQGPDAVARSPSPPEAS